MPGAHLIGSVLLAESVMLKNHPAMEIDPTVPPVALHQWDGKLIREMPDDAYFRPLPELKGFGDTALYLGLVHHDDQKGDLARIAVARRCAPRFGVASECGVGRTDPQPVPGLLESHRIAAEALNGR